MYRRLDPEKIVETVETLGQRIDARFSGAGLGRVCQELLAIARDSRERSELIARPRHTLRVVTGVLIAVIIGVLVYVCANLTPPSNGFDLVNLVQVSEAGLNILVLLGALVLFLVTAETRLKRARALKAIHELRSLAHVIDMHQLTKDPDRLARGWKQTAASPKENMTAFELVRYLDYCAEMLSLTGKIAALYVQKFDDPVALAAVEEVETLTTGLSRKIGQKISLLNTLTSRADDKARDAAPARKEPLR